ncbi:MAG TPA: hypothetical protein VGG90_03990 [Candidatus Dormibacteraeota bacterium]
MADIEVSATSLIVHIRGADQFFALKSQIEVPLDHIARVIVNPPEAHSIWHGLRIGGTNLPGVITAGRFVHHGEWAFWDVSDPDKAICIELHDEHYARIVVGVDDPVGVAQAITAAISVNRPE